MKRAAKVLPFKKPGKISLFCRLDFAVVFPQLGRNVAQSQCSIEICLSLNLRNWPALPAGARIGCKSILVQGPSVLKGPTSKDDIVLLAARKVAKGEREFIVCYDSKIRLNAGFQENACFGISFGDHAVNRYMRQKVFDDTRRLSGCDEQVEIAYSFPTSAEASVHTDL